MEMNTKVKTEPSVKKSKVKEFASKRGFIMASVGSAVGMANVWGFPHKLGANGGGAFLLAYLIFIFIFSRIGLPAEFAVGRMSGTGTLGTYSKVWSDRNKKLEKPGKAIGWIPLAGSMCIAIGYAVIVAYVFKALFNSLTGSLMTADTGEWFESFALTPHSVIPFHIAIVAITLLTIAFGASSIEKTNKIIMPVFFVIFLILAVRVAFMPGALKGYAFMLIPRWDALKNPMVWIWAMGQAFFSLSITGSGMIVYGAYLDEDTDVIDSAQKIGIFDTIAAMVAACVIIPACFAFASDVGAGPGLLFVTLPAILQNVHLGRIFAIILYVAMIFAGISSLQNMFEAVGESLMNRFPKLNRNVCLILLCAICLGIGLNMEAIFQWGPWMDFVSIYIIPVGATIGAISWFWIMDKDDLLNQVNLGREKKVGNVWHNTGKFLYVPFSLILCLTALGLKVAF